MSHIAPISIKANATLATYRIVTCLTSTANTCKYPASAAERPFGVTADTILDTTAAIPVIVGGIARVEFGGAVTTGNLVAADSSGQGVAHTDVTAGSYVIGVLLGPTTVTGTIAEVLVQPHFKSIP